MNRASCGALCAGLTIAVLAASIPARAGGSDLFSDLGSDFKYTLNNGTEDAQDIITAPLNFRLDMLTRPQVYFTLLGAGAALGGAFALDNTLRSHIRGMSNGAANGLEDGGTYSLSAAAGIIFLAGLVNHDAPARHDMITTGEGVAMASVIALAFKYGFGRERPNAGKGAWSWFHGGQSFVSGETTPAFALAAGISQHYDYSWYVALPAYSAAVAVGLGRMGHDAHWFSDVVGAGLIGVGSTELLYYLHKRHEESPGHYWLFPASSDRGGGGVGVGYNW
ncbi:MAG TPA: phosphatase PAP2 family protein [Candidatus Binataceae bacterium]